jgi:1-acyl-sn-glycerol-3-phosphate acyltransferase
MGGSTIPRIPDTDCLRPGRLADRILYLTPRGLDLHTDMMAEISGLLTLVLYVAVATGIVLRAALRCEHDWRLWLLHGIARFYTPLVFRQRIRQRCPFPVEGGALIIVNHRSPVDPILVFSGSPLKGDGYGVRRLEFLTASEYCTLGGFPGFVTRTMQCIPVDRDGRDMGPVKEALRRLRGGRLVGIFPEGRINDLDDCGDLLPGNPGVAWLALHSRLPVYPVFIHGAPQGANMVQPFHRFSRVRLAYGAAIDLSAWYGRRITQELLQEVTGQIMQSLAELGGGTAAEAPREQTATLRFTAHAG